MRPCVKALCHQAFWILFTKWSYFFWMIVLQGFLVFVLHFQPYCLKVSFLVVQEVPGPLLRGSRRRILWVWQNLAQHTELKTKCVGNKNNAKCREIYCHWKSLIIYSSQHWECTTCKKPDRVSNLEISRWYRKDLQFR